MKIRSINIENFKGISELNHDFTKPVTIVTGKVGTGKTSFIQGLKFALTNELPDNPIKKGESSAKVKIECDDDLTIEKEYTDKNKKLVNIMGRTSTLAASTSFIEESSGIPSKIMKLATSSDVLGSMNPADFGSIFLNESSEEKDIDDLIKIMTTTKTKERDALVSDSTFDEDDPKLPPDVLSEIKKLFVGKNFGLEAIKKAQEEASAKRRERAAAKKISEVRSKGYKEMVKPEYSEADLNKKYEEIVGVENNVEAYKSKVLAYNAAYTNKQAQDKKISELEMLIAMSTATEPDPNELKSYNQGKKDVDDEIVKNSRVLQTMIDHKKLFKDSYDQLEQSTCPLSAKLVCKTDKTSLKHELEEEIKNTELSIAIMQDKINELKKKISDIEEKIVVYNKNKEKWEKRAAAQSELDYLLKNPITLPERPEKIEKLKANYNIEKAEIKEKLETLRQYREAENEYKETVKLRRLYAISDFIVKSLDPKGPVMAEFINTFIEPLEDACNERCRLLKSGFELKLVASNGLTVLFKTKEHAEFLPYTNLSAGEKILASLILTDLINQFYDSRILILDDTDHLDAEAFRLLLDFVNQSGIDDYYDNIIISCVEHDDMLDVIDDFDFDLIEMK